MNKLAVVVTHPIQYYAPLFRLLSNRGNLTLKVFYTWERGAEKFDLGFGKVFEWDIPLLEGYDYSFVSNEGNSGKGFWDIKNPDLINQLREWNPSAVLVYGWNYRSHLRVMRNFGSAAMILFRGDSTLLDEQQGAKKKLRRLILRWVYKPVHKALYVGTNNKAYYLECGLKEHQLHYAPHSVDNDRFGRETEDQRKYREDLMQEMRIPPHAKKILFTGKLQPKKNPVLLLQAFLQLNRPDLQLIFAGDGEQEQELKSMAAGQTNIHFLPFQNQSMMPAVYRLGDVFCLPSQGPGETWGLAINEAMASGKAIIASDKVGGAIDLVQDGVNGYIFESNNLPKLVDTIRLVMDGDFAKMGDRSKNMINSWSLERQAECIEQALSETE